MKWNRISAAVAVSTALALSMAGCGGAGGGSGSAANAGSGKDAATATGTIRVLTPSYPADNAGKAAFQKVVDEFHKTYPKMEVQPDYATYANLNEKISTSIAGGGGYDVIVSGVGWIQPLASKGLFADLSEFGITQAALADKVAPALVPPSTYKDKVYGFPFIIDARAIGFRKSAFQQAGLDPAKPPTTFEDIKAAAEKLTVRDASGKITKPGFDFNTSPGNYRQAFIHLLASTGTPLYKDDKPNFNNDNGVKVLEWMKSMIGNVEEFGQQNAAKTPLVMTNEAAMGFVKSSENCTDSGVGQANCDDLGFVLPDNGKEAEMAGGDIASVGAKSKNKDAAWAFVEAMTKPESENDGAVIGNKIPAAKDMPATSSSLGNPLAKFASEHLTEAIYEGGPANWLSFRADFGTIIDQVLLGKISAKDGLTQIENKALSAK
ncbi:MAG: extracellular solute-binding protein family 1 [Micrococcaceae bacterium]|nr:extracellular solute-binding protein family 1 [Micrococcaceae bacterium]